MSVENMEELRWFRSRFSEVVFVYRDQQEQKEEQMAEYSGRTWLVKDRFHQGTAAVRIGNVQLSDSGIYVCFFKQGLFYEEAILELKVAGWYLKPQVQWRDSRGEKLPASSETHTEDAKGLFSMETTLVVRDSSLGNVTCSTFNPILGQEEAMAMFIPGSLYFLTREHSAKLQLRREWESIRGEQEVYQETKEAALQTTGRLQKELDWRKAAYMADWRKEHFQAWSVTLDPDSAHPILAISQDRMNVTWKDTTMHLDGPFSVLSTEGISSGRCYWEVKIKSGESSEWILGVWREDVEKKGWQAPQSVGVFVDYSKGDISFYNMSDMSHIFSFHEDSFSRTLFPYFRLKSGDVSMILSSMACESEREEGRRKRRNGRRGKRKKREKKGKKERSFCFL
ncbi:hypothetical protein STEG23_006332 [Scotinomys teguina]